MEPVTLIIGAAVATLVEAASAKASRRRRSRRAYQQALVDERLHYARARRDLQQHITEAVRQTRDLSR